VRYVLRNVFGVSALGDAFVVSYGPDVKVLVAEYGDAAAAAAAAKVAAEEFEFYETPHLLVPVGPRVVGVVGQPDAAQGKALADAVIARIGAAK
jgi:hypothetical protein